MRIIYTRPDGGVSVVTPLSPRREGETEGDWLERVKAKTVPADARDVAIIDSSELPERDEYRNAWVRKNGKIVVDMDKAKEVHEARIKEAKAQELRRLRDEELVSGEDYSEQMRAVREASVDTSKAQTPSELPWPEGIPKP